MNARDELVKIVTRDSESSGGDYIWATDLVDAYRAEVRAEAAADIHRAELPSFPAEERAKTWSTATYDSGTEKALHEIALALSAEVDQLRAEVRRLAAQRRFLLKAIARKDARSGEADAAVRRFLGSNSEDGAS